MLFSTGCQSPGRHLSETGTSLNSPKQQQISVENTIAPENRTEILTKYEHLFRTDDNSGIQQATHFEYDQHLKSKPHGMRDELSQFAHTLAADSKAAVNLNNAALFSLALGAALGMRAGLDEQVRENVAKHPKRWGGASDGFNDLGDFRYQIPAIAALYTYTRFKPESQFSDFTDTLISAYTITGLSTLAVKVIANTDRPSAKFNGGDYGFPSHHVAGSFSIAAVLDEYYGPKVGIPAYMLSGLVGWSRIDTQDHDLSDVVFGASLGLIIGKSVAGNHLYGDGRVRLLPYVHPTDGSSGLMLDVSY